MDWRQLLGADDGYDLCPGATAGEVAAAEAALGTTFPAQLRGVYLASNGVFDRTGQWFVIWPLPEVVARNGIAWSVIDGAATLLADSVAAFWSGWGWHAPAVLVLRRPGRCESSATCCLGEHFSACYYLRIPRS